MITFLAMSSTQEVMDVSLAENGFASRLAAGAVQTVFAHSHFLCALNG